MSGIEIRWAETLADARELANAEQRLLLTYVFSPG
jgi:hypothetical protein